MKTIEKKTANDLYNIADKYVNNNFNFIQVNVLEKMSDNMLFEHIEQEDEANQVEEFLNNYSLNDEFDNFYSENFEADEPRTELTREEELEKMLEFVREEHENSFENYKSEEQGNNYPMWNTCFEFRHEPSEETIEAAKKAGFGVIRGLDDFNTTLFVAGCGYSFHAAHWIPLVIELNLFGSLKEEAEGVDFSMM